MNLKLTDLATRYTYESVLAEDSAKTYHSRAALFDQFHAYESIEDLNLQDVLKWRDQLIAQGIRATSINNYVRHCKVLWKFAYDLELISDRTVFNVKKLPEVKIKRVIGDGTIKAAFSLIRTMDDDWFWLTLVLLQSQTGIRNRQMRNIRAGDIDFANAVLYCRPEGNKTKGSNELPLSVEMVKCLHAYSAKSQSILGRDLHRGDYLFDIARYNSAYKKQPNGISENQFQSVYTKLSKTLLQTTGERITGHRLRHTLATKIGSQANANIRVVQEFFGWASIQTAQNYVQVGLSQKRDLLGAMRNSA